MSRRLVGWLIKLGIIGLITAWLVRNPGVIRIDWYGWQAQFPTALAVIVLGLIILIVWKFATLWTYISERPRVWAQNRQRRKLDNGYHALQQGLLAAATGDGGQARRQADLAERLLGKQPGVQLLAAQAAQLSGDHKAAARFFSDLAQKDKTRLPGLHGQLRLAEATENPMRQREIAREIVALSPSDPRALHHLIADATEQEDWDKAETYLRKAQPGKKSHKSTPIPSQASDDHIIRHSWNLADIHYHQALKARAEGSKSDALRLAGKALHLDPGHAAAAILTAQIHQDNGQTGKGQRILRACWRYRPAPEIADLYQKLGPKNEGQLEKLRRMEKLIADNPDHLESRYLLAEESLDAQIWGRARHLLSSLESDLDDPASPPARFCRLMARLEEEGNADAEESRRWLLAAAFQAPSPHLIDQEPAETSAEQPPDTSVPEKEAGALVTTIDNETITPPRDVKS